MKSASPLVYLGIGAAIATGALFLMSQSVPPTSPHSGSYGPPKKNVVNVFEFPTNSPILAPGQELVVYTVPSDRWLTVTACDALVNSTLGSGCTQSSPSKARWGESYGGVFTPKGVTETSAPVYSGSAVGQLGAFCTPPGGDVGWVFRPGSQLVIKNPCTVTSGQVSVFYYSVIGYLSRE